MAPPYNTITYTASHLETMKQRITQIYFSKQYDHAIVMSIHITYDNDRYTFIADYTTFFCLNLSSNVFLLFCFFAYFETDDKIS